MEQLSSSVTIQELFYQYLTQWREHLDTVKYSSNPSDYISCQVFKDLVNLWKDESSHTIVIALIEREYRAYVEANDRYQAESEADPERMHQSSLLPEPSSRVWNYLLVEIDPSFQLAIDKNAPDRRSREIRDVVLNHFATLGITHKEFHSNQKTEK